MSRRSATFLSAVRPSSSSWQNPLRARGACRLTYSYVKGQLPYVIFARERGPTRTFEQMSCTFGSISYVIAGRLGRGAQYVNLRNTLNCVLLVVPPTCFRISCKKSRLYKYRPRPRDAPLRHGLEPLRQLQCTKRYLSTEELSSRL